MEELPVVILATSISAVKKYAKSLGLTNFEVYVTPSELEGLLSRGTIITPGYMMFVLDTIQTRANSLWVAYQNDIQLNNQIG